MNTRIATLCTVRLARRRVTLTAFFFSVLLTIVPLQAQDGQAKTHHAASVSGGVAARTEAGSTPGLYNPVADPGSVVTLGNGRFTVLTPQMIRMEWSADGKFEDHPSFVFLNRRLPVPKFTHSISKDEGHQTLQLKTDELSLTYTQAGDGKFTSDNLHVDFMLNGKAMSWHPGMEETGNLMGTTRTLDGALGGKTREPMGPGLI